MYRAPAGLPQVFISY